jgi:hypothetical protein
MQKKYVEKIIARLAARQTLGPAVTTAPAVGDILPARIIRKTGPNHYLVEMRQERLHVESTLAFSPGEVYVQIRELTPRTRLRLISAYREQLPGMIDIARKEKIFLDDFNQWCLAELMQTRYSFIMRDTAGDIEKIRALARSLYHVHLIPLPCYVKMLAGKPAVFDAAAKIMRHERVDLSLPEGEVGTPNPEDRAELYAECYRKYRLGGAQFHPEQPDLVQISHSLGEVQAFLDPGFALSAFLVPEGNRSRLVAVERRRSNAGGDVIDRYQMQVRMPGSLPVIATVRVLGEDVHVRLLYVDKELAGPRRRLEPAMRRLAAEQRKALLPVQHEVTLLRPLLPSAGMRS